MFTGLIQDIGTLVRVARTGSDATFEIASSLDTASFELGESVAVDGCCLTVTRFGSGRFSVDLSAETLRRSHLGVLSSGARVHLERALRVGDRLGGHFVQGHVDGVGTLRERRAVGAGWELRFAVDASLLPELVEKGSVAINGVSLTVNALRDDGFEVMIIPHTQGRTLLLELRPGSTVNIETDMLAKHVRRLMMLGQAGPARLDELLQRHGYMARHEA
jgi:riboflavin synthase